MPFSDEQMGGHIEANTPEFTVKSLSTALKKTLEDSFARVRVRGELGRVTRAASGHIYVDLKEDQSIIAAIIWASTAKKLNIDLAEGLEIIATGRISAYAGQSKYNLIIEHVEIAGEGALMAMLERRRKMLMAEGLFDPSHKKPLPALPRKIGVISSASGAVIRDIIHRVSERFPTEIILWPVAVQGAACAPSVVAALEGFNALAPGHPARPDLLIVARGGGSIEDLWGFNEEAVVRAVFASDIPVISAIGHETDTTLVDHVADLRAPTPTAAAEMAVAVKAELESSLAHLEARRQRSYIRLLSQARTHIAHIAKVLGSADRILAAPRQRLDRTQSSMDMRIAHRLDLVRARLDALATRISHEKLWRFLDDEKSMLVKLNTRLSSRLFSRLELAQQKWRTISPRFSLVRLERLHRDKKQAFERVKSPDVLIRHRVSSNQQALGQIGRMLESLSYTRVLERGFTVVKSPSGHLISRARDAKEEAGLHIIFADGAIQTTIDTKG